MYVCLCHGITDRQIRAHCAVSPVCSASQIYRARGVAPKCGKCVSMVRALVGEARSSAGAGDTGGLLEPALA